jgi:DNA polymerase I-like protein with 3'-5' exonuclease and polymerase domains
LYKAKDKFAKDMRQLSKSLNFGLPGGLGSEKYVLFAKASYGVIVTVEEAKELKQKWLRTWPEMAAYFQWVQKQIEATGDGKEGIATQLRSNRVRARVIFTKFANTLFQGLGADLAKDALWNVTKECYVVQDSPLYGSRPVVFAHDEVITELLEDRAEAAAYRQSAILEERGRVWCPGVKTKAPAALMKNWFKASEPVWQAEDGSYNERRVGKLVPWTPQIGDILKREAAMTA